MKLSILICTIPKRETMFKELVSNLILQRNSNVEVLVDYSEFDSIGEKRNRLLEKANGEYLSFVDDDDEVSEDYIKLLLDAAKTDCDCASLMGMYSVDGIDDGVFEHSIKYDKWETVSGAIKYLRFPNHLNMIKSSIAKQFKFPEKNFSEDFDWSTQIHESGLLKTEHYIPEIIYYYKYISNK